MRASTHAAVASNAALLRVVRGSSMEGAMYRLDSQCDDDETPIPSPDPLTTIFEWIESDDDAHEGAPQAPTMQHPALLRKEQTTLR
jgi:hypothetical protein